MSLTHTLHGTLVTPLLAAGLQAQSPPPVCPGAAWHLIPVPTAAADLRGAIEGARDTSWIQLGRDTFSLNDWVSVTLENKRCLRITGEGPASVIQLGPAVSEGIRISDNVTGLEISGLTMMGTLEALDTANVHAIVARDGARGIRHVVLRDLEIRDMNVGIIVGAGAEGEFDSVWVAGNDIHDMRGSNAPRGYGIQNIDATNIWITGNRVADTDRHSIYQARGHLNITIEGNLILNHARKATDQDWTHVALVVARSSNVVVAQNSIVNSYTAAISIEQDEMALQWPVTNVLLIGNTILGSRHHDIWLNATGRFASWGNRIVRAGGNRQKSIRADQGRLETFRSGEDLQGAVVWKGRVYLLENDCHRTLDPGTGRLTTPDCPR